MIYKPTDNHHLIYLIEMAARSVGMSYGPYVALTGGAVPPPEWLRMQVDPDALICPECGKRFFPTGRHQKYCSPACRKAAYDQRTAAEKQQKKQDRCKSAAE